MLITSLLLAVAVYAAMLWYLTRSNDEIGQFLKLMGLIATLLIVTSFFN